MKPGADPARAGLGDPVIDYLFRCKARTLVYVACDLATQVSATLLLPNNTLSPLKKLRLQLVSSRITFEITPPVAVSSMLPRTTPPSTSSQTFQIKGPPPPLQARDLKQLCNPANPRHFTLESVQICDMFPQTSHVESVAVLRRLVTWHGDKQKNAYVKMKRVKRDEFLYDKSGLNW